MTIDDVIRVVEEKTSGKKVPGADAIYQVHVSGPDGGDFYVVTKDGIAEVHRGNSERPGIAAIVSMENLALLMERRVDAVGLYFQGKISVEGDLSLAFKLQNML
jgi:hypothetical protein